MGAGIFLDGLNGEEIAAYRPLDGLSDKLVLPAAPSSVAARLALATVSVPSVFGTPK